MKKTIFILLTAFLLAGCITAPQKSIETSSGKPEVVIAAPIGKIKEAIISDLVNFKYEIEKDSAYSLMMARPLDDLETMVVGITIGNPYSENHRVVNYTLAPQGESVRVIANIYNRAKLPIGKINTADLNSGRVFNTFMEQLQQIKGALEVK